MDEVVSTTEDVKVMEGVASITEDVRLVEAPSTVDVVVVVDVVAIRLTTW